jgi:hypothetical protein
MGARYLGKHSVVKENKGRRDHQAKRGPVMLQWQRGVDRYPPGYYVYKLVDPRDGSVFYVGKGQRKRAWMHHLLVASGRSSGNRQKDARIQMIIATHLETKVVIDSIYQKESDALEREFQLVDASPSLVNVMPGGIGPASTPEQIDRLQRIREAKRAAVRHREALRANERNIDHREREFTAIASTPEQKKEISDWLRAYRVTGATFPVRGVFN